MAAVAVALVLTACEPTEPADGATGASATAGVVTPTSAVPASAEAAGDCVDFVMAKAFLGDAYWGQLWTDLGQQPTALRTWCTEFALADPAGPVRMKAEYDAIQRDQASAVAPQTTVPNIQPFVSAPPATQAPAQGPSSSGNCDPNYGGCVPIAADVDCAGGTGNGPEYTSGPVEVVGDDVYELDRDGNGWGCD